MAQAGGADLICPKCRKINRAGAKFCMACGQRLQAAAPGYMALKGADATTQIAPPVEVECPVCHAKNRHESRFCFNCGKNLQKAPSGPAGDYRYKNMEPGDVLLNRYRVERILGKGGQSYVYLVSDQRLGRQVAIKELRTDHIYPERAAKTVEYFSREAMILARLRHLNLPSIIDFFEHEKKLYLVMEYIDGLTLERILEESPGPIGEDQVLEWTRQLCDVLTYLHSQKPPVIFRDLKPSNIMLTRDNVIKLIDFNIAKIFNPDQDGSVQSVTQEFGTPGYASPELFSGSGMTDSRTDIYSLGVTMIALLTREDPSRYRFDLPKIEDSNPGVSINTRRVIYKAINFSPAERYQTAAEMWSDLLRGYEGVKKAGSGWESQVREVLFKAGRANADQLSEVPASYRVDIIRSFISSSPDLALAHSADYQSIWLERSSEWQSAAQGWERTAAAVARGDKSAALNDSIDRLVGAVERLLAFRRNGELAHAAEFDLISWDISSLLADLGIQPVIPVAVLRAPAQDEARLDALRQGLRARPGTSSRLVVVWLFFRGQEFTAARELLHKKMKVYAHDVISLGIEDLFQLFAARNPAKAFRSILLSQVDLTAVSPFIINGPTTQKNFFGRENEIQSIAEHIHSTSFAIIGGRRIGKSSLLKQLHTARLPSLGYRTIYHDCQVTPDYQAFTGAPILDWSPGPPASPPLNMGALLKSPPRDRRIVLLLDEADKLVLPDRANNWKLFSELRSLANSGSVQVILCGERTLREALRDPRSPLFNFVNEMLLGPLDFRSAEELITLPMRQLEIQLIDERAIVNQIWTFSSGHPNVIQRICNRLIRQLNERGSRRIDLENVNAVIENPAFQRDDFLDTYWETATPLEKIITLVMAEEKGACTLKSIIDLIGQKCHIQVKAGDVDSALQRLVDLRSILKRSPGGYAFAVEAFPKVLSNTATIAEMLLLRVEEYQEQQT